MDFYKLCHVLCQIWLLPSWTMTMTLPGDTTLGVTKESVLNETTARSLTNITLSVSTMPLQDKTDLATDNTTESILSSNYTEISPFRKPSQPDTTTKLLSPLKITTVIENLTSSKNIFNVDDRGFSPPENGSAITAEDKDKPDKDGQHGTTKISDLNAMGETTPVISTTFDSERNNTSDSVVIPLEFSNVVNTTHYNGNRYNETNGNESSVSSSTNLSYPSINEVTTNASPVRKTIVSTTPHPSVVRNMWLAKRMRSRTHTHSLHHLSLVPIEDGPFGSLIWKDKKYLITVLVPIGIGIIGAVCIISMAYLVRFCHRHERKMQEIRENIQKTMTTQNDQVILLNNSSDDEF